MPKRIPNSSGKNEKMKKKNSRYETAGEVRKRFQRVEKIAKTPSRKQSSLSVTRIHSTEYGTKRSATLAAQDPRQAEPPSWNR